MANYREHKKRNEEKGNGFGFDPKDPERESNQFGYDESIQERFWQLYCCPKSEGQGELGLIESGSLNKDGYLDIMNRVYDPNGLAPTIHSRTGGGMIPKIDVTGLETDSDE